jgi:hypothetical protein
VAAATVSLRQRLRVRSHRPTPAPTANNTNARPTTCRDAHCSSASGSGSTSADQGFIEDEVPGRIWLEIDAADGHHRRSGDLELEKTLVLERAYASAMHEIGHMFQLQHCIAWECPMNGCNHQEEADTRPLEPCPHCLTKLSLATGLDPRKRWAELRAAFEAAGLTRGVKEIDRELSAK